MATPQKISYYNKHLVPSKGLNKSELTCRYIMLCSIIKSIETGYNYGEHIDELELLYDIHKMYPQDILDLQDSPITITHRKEKTRLFGIFCRWSDFEIPVIQRCSQLIQFCVVYRQTFNRLVVIRCVGNLCQIVIFVDFPQSEETSFRFVETDVFLDYQ